MGSSLLAQTSGSVTASLVADPSPAVLFSKFVAYAILIAFILCAVMIIWGGISIILSGGDEGKLKKAVGSIRFSIFGLIITVLATIIVGYIGKILGYDITTLLDIQQIFKDFTSIISSLGGGTGSGGL